MTKKDTPTSWYFERPELAKAHLDAFDTGFADAMAFYAPRRMGKTQYLIKDLTPAAEQRGYQVGYCNLWEEEKDPRANLVKAIKAMALPRGLSAKVGAALKTPVDKIKLTGKSVGVEAGAELQLRSAVTKKPLRAAFEDFDASKNRGLLLIDEAYTLTRPEHDAVEKALRALLDTRKEQIKVIFTGSSEGRLRTMFGSYEKAFYQWASLSPFPRLGHEFVAELTRRANALSNTKLDVSAARAAFEELHGLPESFKRFVTHYITHPWQGVRGAIADAKTMIQDEERFDVKWAKIRPADRVVLGLVIEGREDLHGKHSRAEIGRILGLGAPVPMSVPQMSLRRLRNAGIVLADEPGKYRLADELFAEWIAAKGLTKQLRSQGSALDHEMLGPLKQLNPDRDRDR